MSLKGLLVRCKGNQAESPALTTGGSAPSDFAAQASRRVAALAAIMALATAYGIVRGHVLLPLAEHEHVHMAPHLRDVGVLLLFVASIALGVVAWRGLLPPRTVLRLGLGFEVLVSGWISLMVALLGWGEDVQHVGLPPAAMVVLVAPALVPVRWRARLITTTLATLAMPAAMVLAVALGVPAPDPYVWLLLVSPMFLAGGMALLMARILGHLTAEVGRARQEAQELGSYRLVEELGRGGMGEVWRAEHRMLARPAAIKLIHPRNLRHDDPDRKRVAMSRFEREAKAMAALTSPHTAQVFDFGITPDGSFYYVMELLDGVDLGTLVKEDGPLPVDRAVRLLRQLCASLAEAHARGVVHRDIKPANLMSCNVGLERDFLKVLDFGLVMRREDGPDSDDEKLTQAGSIIGTPSFLAPEMAMGKTDIDERADVYAIGCVAFFLLTGENVFSGDTTMAVIIAHVQEKPRRVGDIVPVPAELDRLVSACLEKEPSQRPADAGDVLETLRTISA